MLITSCCFTSSKPTVFVLSTNNWYQVKSCSIESCVFPVVVQKQYWLYFLIMWFRFCDIVNDTKVSLVLRTPMMRYALTEKSDKMENYNWLSLLVKIICSLQYSLCRCAIVIFFLYLFTYSFIESFIYLFIYLFC